MTEKHWVEKDSKWIMISPKDTLIYAVYQYSKKETLEYLKEAISLVESSNSEEFWMELVIKEY